MSWPICVTSGKQMFPSPQVARASLNNRRQREKGPHRNQKGYVYRCPECRRWHLTRVPPEQIRRSRRAS